MKSTSNQPKSFEAKIDHLSSNKAFKLFAWVSLIIVVSLTFLTTRLEFGNTIGFVSSALIFFLIILMSGKIANAKRIGNRELSKKAAFTSGMLEATAFWTFFLIINLICYKTYQGFVS